MTSCPACAGEWIPERRAYRSGEWTVVRCARCGTGVTTPRPDPEALERAYSDPAYYESHGIHHAGILSDHRARARAILARAPGRRLLEVGCGEGYLLAALRDEGFEVKGCEVSQAGTAEARRRFGLDVHLGSLEEARLPSDSFDVVVMYHVLEHVAQPDRLLSVARGLLRAHGLLVVEVPNLSAAHVLRPRMRRHILDLPFHLIHFTPVGFRQLLERSGFRLSELTIPFGPPLAPLLAAYERARDFARNGRTQSVAPMPRPPGAPRDASRRAQAGVKEWILDCLRTVSAAYKMTAWAERTVDHSRR